MPQLLDFESFETIVLIENSRVLGDYMVTGAVEFGFFVNCGG